MTPENSRVILRVFIMNVGVMLWLATLCTAQEMNPQKPTAMDKCPVCGMFVSKYPDWVTQIIYKDGQVVFFDGMKDLFKYYFNLKRYEPDKSETDIGAIYATEYYHLKMIDARKAVYVIGSDLYGPMGRELIPFASKADAEQFLKDHSGKSILTFDEVTPAIIKTLD